MVVLDTPLIVNPATYMGYIKLQVGERVFETTTETLGAGSNIYTKCYIERRDRRMCEQVFYFDLDGDIFEHILRWLRHRVVPLFMRPDGALDQTKYSMLRDQAKLFEVEELLERIPEGCVLPEQDDVYLPLYGTLFIN
ncbi:hypothetical protein MMC10_008670 [Thelotrema lepadinum]|nr:hypothetical protein [Thelotrema lepadinum]